MKNLRHRARELAVQLLYQNDLTGETPQETLGKIRDWVDPETPESVVEYCQIVVRLTLGYRGDIDERISGIAEHWKLARMSVVDRNIIRLAAAEMLYKTDVPVKVSINEAIELAKRFGDEESGRFVNGILDRLASRIADERQNSDSSSF